MLAEGTPKTDSYWPFCLVVLLPNFMQIISTVLLPNFIQIISTAKELEMSMFL